MSVSGGFGICDNDPWEVGGCDVVTVVRNVGTTVSPIVVLPKVVLKGMINFYIYIKQVGDGGRIIRVRLNILPGRYCRFCGYGRFYYRF